MRVSVIRIKQFIFLRVESTQLKACLSGNNSFCNLSMKLLTPCLIFIHAAFQKCVESTKLVLSSRCLSFVFLAGLDCIHYFKKFLLLDDEMRDMATFASRSVKVFILFAKTELH